MGVRAREREKGKQCGVELARIQESLGSGWRERLPDSEISSCIAGVLVATHCYCIVCSHSSDAGTRRVDFADGLGGACHKNTTCCFYRDAISVCPPPYSPTALLAASWEYLPRPDKTRAFFRASPAPHQKYTASLFGYVKAGPYLIGYTHAFSPYLLVLIAYATRYPRRIGKGNLRCRPDLQLFGLDTDTWRSHLVSTPFGCFETPDRHR